MLNTIFNITSVICIYAYPCFFEPVLSSHWLIFQVTAMETTVIHDREMNPVTMTIIIKLAESKIEPTACSHDLYAIQLVSRAMNVSTCIGQMP